MEAGWPEEAPGGPQNTLRRLLEGLEKAGNNFVRPLEVSPGGASAKKSCGGWEERAGYGENETKKNNKKQAWRMDNE